MNNYFNEIICISLDKNKKRRDYAKYYFSKLGLDGKFFIVDKDKRGGLYGCFISHIILIKYALKKNYDNILVFEDDFMPTRGYSKENLEKAIDFMKSNNDWDCFYLGYSTINYNKWLIGGLQITKEIFKFRPTNTHAIVYNKRGMKKIIANYHNYLGKVHYDIHLSNHLKLNSYCYLPLMFEQNFSLDYDTEPTDLIELIGKKLYPFLFTTNFHYWFSLFIYYLYY